MKDWHCKDHSKAQATFLPAETMRSEP